MNSYEPINGNTKAVKGKHLSRDERIITQTLTNEGYSNRQIAGKLSRAPQIINNETKPGAYTQKSQHNINLLMKLKLKNKKPTGFTRINKKGLGQSIELRPYAADTRVTFGHW